MNAFVFKVKKTFDLSCLLKGEENVSESRELDHLGGKLSFSFDMFLYSFIRFN